MSFVPAAVMTHLDLEMGRSSSNGDATHPRNRSSQSLGKTPRSGSAPHNCSSTHTIGRSETTIQLRELVTLIRTDTTKKFPTECAARNKTTSNSAYNNIS